MANLFLSDILTSVRLIASEPSVQGRYPDSELTNYVNLALIQTMVRVEWPEGTYSIQTDGLTKEWQLPELYALLRVYVAGQICVPTSIALLQGDPLGIYDESTVNFNPQWKQAPFTGYPVAANVSSPVTNAVPYFTGQRPEYYLRGGFLGIVPPATSGSTIAIDVYPAPTPLVNSTDQTFFPQLFKEAIAARSLMYAALGDGIGSGKDSVIFSSLFEEQVTKVLIPFKNNIHRSLPNTPIPTTHRTYFQGPFRGPRGSGSRFGG